MKKILILLSLLSFSWRADAHQTELSSTLLIEQENNEWVLQVRAALTAFEYEIETHYGANSYNSPEEFQKLVVDYTRENTTLIFNEGSPLILENGVVHLGHETSVSFQIKNTPSELDFIEYSNTSFENISRNKSALLIFKKGFAREQFILNNENNHSIKLAINGLKFEKVAPKQIQKRNLILIFLLIILSFLVITFILRKKYPKELRLVPILS